MAATSHAIDDRAPAAGMVPQAEALEQCTLAVSGYGGGRALRTVLLDWFEFLGGRPGEVVYVDGGSPSSTTRRLTGLLHEGLIDKLELLTPAHWENSFDRCYIQEYQSGRLATRPYIIFVKLDVLPYRRGHDGWLAEDLAALDRPGVFAVTFSHLIDPPVGRDGPYLVYDFLSLNYGIIKRETFHRSLEEQIGPFIESGFRGEYPGNIECEPQYRRALLEWAWQNHCRRHGLRTLARPESPDWTIIHVNKSGRKLLEYRRKYRRREGVEKYFDLSKALYRPPLSAWQRVGRAVEAAVRSLVRSGRARA